ncbi:phytanoyl-CoA dioxygenase family protein [Cavenderia fasciculata]|uniref:Phytanoyl-CoA dioxygenase family protein n=1 Tax=Cavenderia fasciculata TaxID=261658 RepID=F4PQF5_CACFS|nr:phytanoyl-CoA dioxygenase family protein [Cavenderia fasciculata]EGG22618.1 phytanoyl-CoA dioxygenase family protein [Cavenderia fasciculata]|eukprot:XP_004360469.1 phytanoyl-CoA dioxygenase family protein [Cavenderia fasciculata]
MASIIIYLFISFIKTNNCDSLANNSRNYELNWRPNLSRNDTTRELANAFKCDPSFARVALSEKLGKVAADLMGWEGARLAQDDLFWKPIGGGPIKFHQDEPYLTFFNPVSVVTIWLALTDVSTENGTLEYVKGSHKWNTHSGMVKNFHVPPSYTKNLNEAAQKEGIEKPDVVPVVVPKGGCGIHHGLTWHGSGSNTSMKNERMAYALCFIPDKTKFKEKDVGFIYGRYKLHNSVEMEESFFPITYSKDGYKSESINSFIN